MVTPIGSEIVRPHPTIPGVSNLPWYDQSFLKPGYWLVNYSIGSEWFSIEIGRTTAHDVAKPELYVRLDRPDMLVATEENMTNHWSGPFWATWVVRPTSPVAERVEAMIMAYQLSSSVRNLHILLDVLPPDIDWVQLAKNIGEYDA